MTPAEYLEIERKAEFKSEFYRGEMYAMSGATRWHVIISGNVLVTLHTQLRKRPCTVYSNDLRVLTRSDDGLYTYPDVVGLCGEPQFLDGQLDTLLNPEIIIEVLSPSTEGYDRGFKFQQYQSIPTLREYLLVAQDRCRMEQYVKQASSQWLYTETSDMNATLRLESIGCELPLAEVYLKVEFPPAPPIKPAPR